MYQRSRVPTFTKLYLACSLTLSILIFLKLIDPYNITYTFQGTFLQIALWRPFTAILYLCRISWMLPFQLIFAYIATSKISAKVYQQQQASLAWLFLFSVICLMVFSTVLSSLYFYGSSFVMIMLMVWATRYPTDYVQIGKLQIHSVYFPIIYSTIMIFLGSSYKNYMAGLLIGLIYGILTGPTFISQHGDFLSTPNFLKNYFSRQISEQSRKLRVQQIKQTKKDQFFNGRAYRLS